MKKIIALAVAVALVASFVLALPGLALPGGTGTSGAANKVVAVGSTVDRFNTETQPVTLAQVTGKFSNPTDLMIQFTAESALFTKIKVTGGTNDADVAKAKVVVWVEIDGNAVPVAGTSDDGKVVFDNREFGINTSALDSGQFIELFIRTRSAHAFNWVALNVGSGTHTIVVKAELTIEKSAQGAAEAGVGKRVLIVEPTKMATGTIEL